MFKIVLKFSTSSAIFIIMIGKCLFDIFFLVSPLLRFRNRNLRQILHRHEQTILYIGFFQVILLFEGSLF